VKALPKMAKAANDKALKEAFETHLEETKGHVERLKKVADLLGIKPIGKICKAMQGLVEEGGETIEEKGEGVLRDIALIVAAQKVEHYEISGYGSLKTLAGVLGHDDLVELLQTTEDEEGEADKKLTSIAERLLPQALELEPA